MNTSDGSRVEAGSRDSESLSGERDGLISGISSKGDRKKVTVNARLILLLLLTSIGLNILQLVYVNVHHAQFYSLFAKIPERGKDVTFWYGTEYSEGHEEDKEALWNEIDISEGFIAVPHTTADALGIPRSKTFPWDVNKGMYVTHAYHALHCVVALHAYTHDAHHGKKPFISYHHIEHCLDLLRQDVMCYADDNLDYTKDHGDEFLVSDGQVKKCRDWSKLSEFAKANSACYKTINITRAGQDFGVKHQLDRYLYCPEGSPYEPLIKAWRELSRENSGNIEDGALSDKTKEELQAAADAVVKHNTVITKPDDSEHS